MPTFPDHMRRDVIRICQCLYQRGLIAGSEGNVSVRVAPDRIWITPTGRHKGLLAPDDLLLIDLTGRVQFGVGRPSSETLMHLAVYRRRSDIQAVVHAHPPLATALTIAGRTFESALLPEAVVALGEVPTVPYQMPTTSQFADEVGDALYHAQAVLLEHHGSVSVGTSLEQAFSHMEIVERVAQVYYLAQTLGRVQPLPPAAVAALQALSPA